MQPRLTMQKMDEIVCLGMYNNLAQFVAIFT